MKISHMSIIFIIIMLPLAVILSTYMQLQIDVVIAKEDLSTKLLDATYDGILSFELNSLSIDNTTGASVKEYVSSAVNTFFDTMSINMGKSGGTKLDIQTYVPAILFTSYDGYYIYSPVKSSTPNITASMTSGNLESAYGIAKETKIPDGKEIVVNARTGGITSTTTEIKGNPPKYSDNDSKIEINYMVKPFIYYSANYVSGNNNLVVNYSLDNHIALYAQYGSRTATKSGYLMQYQKSGKQKVKIGGNFVLKGALNEKVTGITDEEELKKISNVDIKVGIDKLSLDNWTQLIECKDANLVYTTSTAKVEINDDSLEITDTHYKKGKFRAGGHEYLIRGTSEVDGKRVNTYETKIEGKANVGYDHGGEFIIDYTLQKEKELGTEIVQVEVLNDDGEYIKIEDSDAKEYYLKSYFFSRWVYSELDSFTVGQFVNIYENGTDPSWRNAEILINNHGIEDIGSIFGNKKLFDLSENPEDESSIFNQHRRQVIQNSIQYNLNSAISTYSKLYTDNIDFSMPELSALDWNNILNKVSMVVFMQGVPIGGSVWGDYAIATSTNNKLFVNKNNLLFIEKDNLSDMESDFHKIDCYELAKSNKELYGAMSYEFAYDAKVENAYVYIYNNTKYYKFKGDWYYYYGVKIVDSSLIDTLKNNAKSLSTAYVRFSSQEYTMKVFFLDTGGSYTSFQYYQYSKTGPDGKLIQISKTPVTNPKEYLEDKKKYTYSYEEAGSQELDLYDHANVGCYWCMMGANYLEVNLFKYYSNTRNDVYFRGARQTDVTVNANQLKNVDKAWLTYLAKYKNNQFKTTDSIQR